MSAVTQAALGSTVGTLRPSVSLFVKRGHDAPHFSTENTAELNETWLKIFNCIFPPCLIPQRRSVGWEDIGRKDGRLLCELD